jgi:hypothetical protein
MYPLFGSSRHGPKKHASQLPMINSRTKPATYQRIFSGQQVCGNPEGVQFIRDWLSEWTDKIAREQQKKLLTAQKPSQPKPAKKWQASEESSEWLVSGGGSDSDLRDEEDGLSNVLLLSGPTGVSVLLLRGLTFRVSSFPRLLKLLNLAMG